MHARLMTSTGLAGAALCALVLAAAAVPAATANNNVTVDYAIEASGGQVEVQIAPGELAVVDVAAFTGTAPKNVDRVCLVMQAAAAYKNPLNMGTLVQDGNKPRNVSDFFSSCEKKFTSSGSSSTVSCGTAGSSVTCTADSSHRSSTQPVSASCTLGLEAWPSKDVYVGAWLPEDAPGNITIKVKAAAAEPNPCKVDPNTQGCGTLSSPASSVCDKVNNETLYPVPPASEYKHRVGVEANLKLPKSNQAAPMQWQNLLDAVISRVETDTALPQNIMVTLSKATSTVGSDEWTATFVVAALNEAAMKGAANLLLGYSKYGDATVESTKEVPAGGGGGGGGGGGSSSVGLIVGMLAAVLIVAAGVAFVMHRRKQDAQGRSAVSRNLLDEERAATYQAPAPTQTV